MTLFCAVLHQSVIDPGGYTHKYERKQQKIIQVESYIKIQSGLFCQNNGL